MLSLLALLFLFGGKNCRAQGTNFNHLGRDDGLSSDLVTVIFRDSRGFMWIGTQEGLNRYDGYEILSYRNNSADTASLPGNSISSIAASGEEVLWIGTAFEGLVRYNYAKDEFKSWVPGSEKGDSLTSIPAIAALEGGRLLIGTSGGLFVFDPASEAFSKLDLSEFGNASVRCISRGPGDEIWVGTGSGLFSFNMPEGADTGKKITVHKAEGLPELAAVNAMAWSQGGLWIGTEEGIFNWDALRGAYQEPKLGRLHATEITSIAIAPNGFIWISTFGEGLYRFNPGSGLRRYNHVERDKGSLSDDYVNDLFIDESGLLWAGTYRNGISTLDLNQSAFEFLSTGPAGAGQEVFAIAGLGDSWWYGTDQGLVREDIATGWLESEVLSGVVARGDAAIYALESSSDKTIWVATNGGGLIRIPDATADPGLILPEKVEGLASELLLSLEEDSKGRIWVGSVKGLELVSSEGEHLRTYLAGDKGLGNGEVAAILEDKGGTLWLGTSQDLFRYDEKEDKFEFFPLRTDNASGDIFIFSLFEDAQERLWVGTEVGLQMVGKNRKEVQRFTREDGLPNNVVYKILGSSAGEGGQEDIWFSTDNGLCRLVEQPLEGGVSFTFVPYTRENGLECTTFNGGAGLRAGNVMLFGCNKGLVRFEPENVIANQTAPPVLITDFQLFFEHVPFGPGSGSPLLKPIWETDSIVLTHDQNVLYFEFAALNYLRNERNQYACKMEGFDKDWIYARGKRYATYTNLDPGDYVFRVKASNNEGVWNEEGTALYIRIEPPFIRTIWFYLIIGLGALLAIFLFVQFRTMSLRRQRRVLERTVNERTEEVEQQKAALESTLQELKSAQTQLVESEKMASLGQLTAGVAHEINNPINFVSGNVEPLRRDIDDLLEILAAYQQKIEEKSLQGDFEEVEKLKEELDYDFLVVEIKNLLEGIGEGADRTALIVRSLRNFSRLDEEERKRADIHEGLESTLLILRNEFKDRIEIVKEFGQLPQIMCYPGKLNQVFMNILNNAIQAIEGKGTVTIQTEMQGGMAVISIRDSGKGMPEEVRKRIFEPFFTTKEVGKGTGMGLSISFGIIEKHNGRIEVESEEGKGTTFRISIPLELDN